jgi:hypothetical protein
VDSLASGREPRKRRKHRTEVTEVTKGDWGLGGGWFLGDGAGFWAGKTRIEERSQRDLVRVPCEQGKLL